MVKVYKAISVRLGNYKIIIYILIKYYTKQAILHY